MIFPRVCRINPAQFYLLMTQALLLLTTIRTNLNLIPTRFNERNKWFCSNLLTLNYDKTYFLKFSTKTDYKITMQVSFGGRKIATAQSLKFLGLTIDTTLTWKHHISELTTRLNKACYAISSIKTFMSLDVLRSTYFSYAHSLISY